MKRRKKQRREIGTPPVERVGNAPAGAVVGAVVAGPVGAVAGAAVGPMVEKGVRRPTRRTNHVEERDNQTKNTVRQDQNLAASEHDA